MSNTPTSTPDTSATFTAEEKLEVIAEDIQELMSSGSIDMTDGAHVYADVVRIMNKLSGKDD